MTPTLPVVRVWSTSGGGVCDHLKEDAVVSCCSKKRAKTKEWGVPALGRKQDKRRGRGGSRLEAKGPRSRKVVAAKMILSIQASISYVERTHRSSNPKGYLLAERPGTKLRAVHGSSGDKKHSKGSGVPERVHMKVIAKNSPVRRNGDESGGGSTHMDQ